MSDTSNRSSGIGFVGALAILFIALKLTAVINWSWLWVLAPIWIPFTLGFVAVAVILWAAVPSRK